MIVGRDQRLFAAHEDVLSASPFFNAALNFVEGKSRDLYVYEKKDTPSHRGTSHFLLHLLLNSGASVSSPPMKMFCPRRRSLMLL
jgi:hypothetical protein